MGDRGFRGVAPAGLCGLGIFSPPKIKALVAPMVN